MKKALDMARKASAKIYEVQKKALKDRFKTQEVSK
jgi:hypothetical protein